MIKKIFTKVSIALTLLVPLAAQADWRYATRGYLSARLSAYTGDTSSDYGQYTRAKFEQTTEMTTNVMAMNQLRWSSNSLSSDLNAQGISNKKDNYDVFLGENYLKIKGDSWVTELGYQEVVWGEAFGLNYADIINPKDQKITLYNEASDARLPLLMFNGKKFFSSGGLSGSLQFIYSPEPRFNKTLPLDLFVSNILPQSTITVNKEKTPKIFKESEIGGKLSTSYAGFDTSLFYFNYKDRDPSYLLESATLTSVTLQEEHTKIKSSGVSLAKTVFDFVFRTDVVYNQNKTINYLNGTNLSSYQTKSINALVSIDSPSYNNYSAVFILARSTLSDFIDQSFREKNEQYSIVKISKDLGGDKILDLAYTHQFEHSGHAIQTMLNWPVNSTTDLKIGGEFYFGDNQSNLKKFKNISSVFFSLKNYFQL